YFFLVGARLEILKDLFLFPPLTAWLIASVGWQTTWIVLGGINITFAVLIGGFVLIRNRPEELGQVPYGKIVETGSSFGVETLINKNIDVKFTDWHIKQAIREPALWLIILVGATNYYAFGVTSAHQIAYLKDIGFSVIVAALLSSLVSGMSVIGRFGFGVLALRINIRKLIITSFILQVCAFIILSTTENPVLIYLYAVFFGVSCGAIIVAIPTIVGEYFGRANYAQIMGFVLLMCVGSQSTGPVIAGIIYETTTTYTLAFILMTCVSLLGLTCAILLRRPKPLNNPSNNMSTEYLGFD
ncbi:MFS transporter, partial [Chloroflexota bacterium]